MSFEQNDRSVASNESMFGCECAMSFLTLRQAERSGRRALSGMALGAVVALGGCDAAPPTPPETAPEDKVSAAFSKVDREIARAKARWSRDDRVAREADAGSAARP